jgi:dual specificity tyrosine-phosphorylation-regulated kinase 1
MSTGLVAMSGQGSGSSSSLMQVSSLPGGSYQPMECESSPRHTGNRRHLAPGYSLTTSSNSEVSNTSTAPTSIQSMDNSRIQSSLGTYNSLILPGMAHLPAMMTSPMIQQQNFYNYGYPSGDSHAIVRPPASVSTGKQRDPEREDSPMVGVCVQQSPVAIH